MCGDPEIWTASEAFEELLEWIYCARSLTEEGNVLEAYRVLSAGAALHSYCEDVQRAELTLARVAEGEITLAGRGGPLTFTSTHAMVAHVVLSLSIIKATYCLPNDVDARVVVARNALAACNGILALDTSKLRAGLIRERAKLLAGVPENKSSTEAIPHKKERTEEPGSEQQVLRAVEAIGDETAVQIMAIAGQKHRSGEERMKAILLLDRRFTGKDSNAWGVLLGVSPAAVRGYGTWKALQAKKKNND